MKGRSCAAVLDCEQLKNVHEATLGARGQEGNSTRASRLAQAETARARGGLGGGVNRRAGADEVEVEGELLRGGRWKDASAKMVAICEYAEKSGSCGSRSRRAAAPRCKGRGAPSPPTAC